MSEIIQDNTAYPEAYGRWAGFPKGHNPDFERCCETVREPGRWGHFSQCRRKRGHGPGLAYCKQHDPEAVSARRKASDDRSRDEWNQKRYEWNGKKFFQALQQIADGHNDARGLAQDVIADFLKGAMK